jgi:hypothetical protein
MSLKSVRQVDVASSKSTTGDASGKATTLQELIQTIPQSYRIRLGDYLTKKYRVAFKHANVNSTVISYQRHETDGSFPPIIRNSLKEPKLQFAKEFLSTTDGSSSPANFQSAIVLARKSVLSAAIKEKKKELECLARLIR